MLWYGLGGGKGVKHIQIPFHLIKEQLTSIRKDCVFHLPYFWSEELWVNLLQHRLEQTSVL